MSTVAGLIEELERQAKEKRAWNIDANHLRLTLADEMAAHDKTKAIVLNCLATVSNYVASYPWPNGPEIEPLKRLIASGGK